MTVVLHFAAVAMAVSYSSRMCTVAALQCSMLFAKVHIFEIICEEFHRNSGDFFATCLLA